MANVLLKVLTKKEENISDLKVRAAVGKASGLIGIICNCILSVCKIIVGLLSSSVSIIADALNNISDAASAIVTLVGFKLAEKPADKEHPYGHARFEYLSGLAVAVMMLVIGLELVKSSVEKILNPTSIDMTFSTGVVLVISIIVKFGLYVLNNILGKSINSHTILATAKDSLNDVIMTTVILIAGIVEYASGWKVDGIMGFVVAIFIIASGVELVKTTISPLIGEGANEELQSCIQEHVLNCDMVIGCHDLMVHDYGPGKRFASIHVEMDKDEDNLICHEKIDNLERECLEKYGVHLVIHYDPIVTNDVELEKMKKIVISILKVRDERMSIHDFRMVPGVEHTNLIFDIAIPMELVGDEDKIKESLENALNDLSETIYYTVITFDIMPI
ncbi:MAG: cation transporter [Lachnospiraceae bacterium]|nr:cation transporter [Lachnospiraceae bacterium]